MPRRPRIHLDAVPLHIVQRGHNREACFFCEDDYSGYLHWLEQALGENECRLHAYALMSNHVHLLLTPRRAASVPRLIISFGRRYVQYVNRTYKRTGTLWDPRGRLSEDRREKIVLPGSAGWSSRRISHLALHLTPFAGEQQRGQRCAHAPWSRTLKSGTIGSLQNDAGGSSGECD